MVVGSLPTIRTLLWICLAIAIPFLLLCLDPDLLSSGFSALLQTWSAINAFLTPTALFFLMNAVVFALAFQSKVLFVAKPGINDSEETDDDDYAEEEYEEEEEARNVAFYPELLTSFFGEEHKPRSKFRRKKTSVPKNPSPSPKPKSTSFANSNLSSRILSQPFRPHHSTNSNKINGVLKARAMSLSRVNGYVEAADLSAEKAVTLNPPPEQTASGPDSDSNHIYGYVDDKNIDEKADAFIDSFYSRMKVPKVNTHPEMLERSHGK